ncbi:uncharacterized protein LOC135503229 isoform X2 [Lineus longissimus]|uniref:uncharacterized protein LOC135503229 isoform X2 n=1 Tax=Lineus longissimus TaxID=88925 RepID=UPI002B4D4312
MWLGLLCSMVTFGLVISSIQDKSFPSSTILFGRNVTCGEHKPGLFPSRTWSCTDIKVDGLRLSFTYMPGLGAAKRECGETKGRNDLAALCNHLLLAQGIEETLWSAFVSQASCHLSQGQRILLRNTSKIHEWRTEEEGKGYIKSIQCMVIS